MFWLTSRNCCLLMAPALRAARPYWTPTLSIGRRANTVALAQHQFFQDAAIAERPPLDVPAADAAAAQRVDQAVIPRARRREGRRRRLGDRIMQDRRLVDAAVDRSGLDADDVGHRLALARRGLREVGRVARRARQRLE